MKQSRSRIGAICVLAYVWGASLSAADTPARPQPKSAVKVLAPTKEKKLNAVAVPVKAEPKPAPEVMTSTPRPATSAMGAKPRNIPVIRSNASSSYRGTASRRWTALPEAQPADVDPDLLKKVSAGISREDLIRKLGVPAGKVTSDEDGHLLETYSYFSNGVKVGAVKLSDGVVTEVRTGN